MYKLKEVVEHFSTAAKETIQKIKHHYGWFSLMFLLEILFLLSFVGIFVYYQINLAFNQEQLFSLMEQANLNATQLQDGGTFMTNQAISSLIGSFQQMINNFVWMLYALFGVFLLFGGLIWGTGQKIMHGKFLHPFLKHSLLAGVFIFPFVLLGHLLLRNILYVEEFNLGWMINSGIALFVISFYFYLIGCGELNNRVKEISLALGRKGIKKFYYFFAVLLVLAAFFVGVSYLVYLSAEGNPLVLVGEFILLCLGLVLFKVYWICLSERSSEKKPF
ncbi:hypothetical protein J4417_00460 [Candidatus Woesearchaeota archaeon]|nr:hypothetical protein [Candidatus Woesearchaeota archaeon]